MAADDATKAADDRRRIVTDFAATPLGRAFWLVWALSVFFIACVDPFGLDSRVETTTEAIVQRVFAGQYPNAAAERIALIEISAAELDRRGSQLTFPLSSEVHAQIVRALTAAGVRAIFIDSEFRNTARIGRDDADDLFAGPEDTRSANVRDQLANAIYEAHARGVPVLTGPIGTRDDLAALRDAATVTSVSWSADHPSDYPLISHRLPTAAASLFLLSCAGADPSPGCTPALKARIGRGTADPIALRFGGGYPAEQWRFSGLAEGDECRDRTFLASLIRELRGFSPPPPCTHHLIVPVSVLLQPGNNFRDLARLLKGRVVLIGAGLGMGDDHVIPGIGTLPGVAIHAMALDNLLTWGASYPRWPRDFFTAVKIGWDEVLKLLALLAWPPLLSCCAAWLCRKRSSAREIALLTTAVALTGSLVLIGCAIMGMFAFAWPLSVALTIAGMSTVVASLLSGPDFRAALRPFADRRGAAVVLGLFAVAVLGLLAPLLLLPSAVCVLVLLAWRLARRPAAVIPASIVEQPENAT